MQYAELKKIADGGEFNVFLEDNDESGVFIGYEGLGDKLDKLAFTAFPDPKVFLTFYIKVDDVEPDSGIYGTLVLKEVGHGDTDYWFFVPKETIEDFDAIKDTLPSFSDNVSNADHYRGIELHAAYVNYDVEPI